MFIHIKNIQQFYIIWKSLAVCETNRGKANYISHRFFFVKNAIVNVSFV